MKVFEILQEETSTVYMYVEANSKKEAEEHAITLDYEHWRKADCIQSGLVEINKIKNPKEELRGQYVERLDGSAEHGDKL